MNSAMSPLDLTLRVVHVLGACIWVGAAFFAAWFLIPSLRDAGPDAAKVMAGVQRRKWMVVLPVIATTTVLTGFWLYRPYMGAEGNAAKYLGFGGVIGTIALILGAGLASRFMNGASKLAAEAAAMTDPAARGAAMKTAAVLRDKALLWARVVSVLVIVAAVLMTMAMYV